MSPHTRRPFSVSRSAGALLLPRPPIPRSPPHSPTYALSPPPSSEYWPCGLRSGEGVWGASGRPPMDARRAVFRPARPLILHPPTNQSPYLSSSERTGGVDIVDIERGQNGQNRTEWPNIDHVRTCPVFGQFPDIAKGSERHEVEVDMSGHDRTCPKIVRTSPRQHPRFSCRKAVLRLPTQRTLDLSCQQACRGHDRDPPRALRACPSMGPGGSEDGARALRRRSGRLDTTAVGLLQFYPRFDWSEDTCQEWI